MSSPIYVILKLKPIYAKKKRKELRREFRICCGCRKQNPDCKECARCHAVCYCNAECQRADWDKHKTMCSKLVNIKDMDRFTRRCFLSIQHAINRYDFSKHKPQFWCVTFKPDGPSCYCRGNFPDYETSLRKNKLFKNLPTSDHVFKIAGSVNGAHAFITRGELYIIKD